MTDTRKELQKLSATTQTKIKNIYGSIDKLYAVIYLIARNEHQCQITPIHAAAQRLRTIHAYQGIIRFMLDEGGLNGQRIMDDIASDYLNDFIKYKEQDFGMTDEEFIAIIKRIV